MFTSVCNFLYETFFSRSRVKPLHRKNVSNDSSFGKRLKLNDYDWNSSFFPSQNKLSTVSMQEKNAEFSDDEECYIIAEMPRRKKAESFVQTDEEEATTSNKCCEILSRPTLSIQRDFSQKNSDDLNEKICTNNTSRKNLNAKSNLQNKFFTNVRTPLGPGKMAKSKLCFRNHLRKRLNFLRESYRLNEKLQYMKLLQSQTLLNLERRPLKCVKYSTENIPVIDLTDESASENNSKSDSESQTSEDQDVQIVGEYKGIRSFQDILKIKPINSETFKKMLDQNSKNTPNSLSIKRIDDNTIDLLDDKDECEDPESNFDSVEEKLKNYLKITSSSNQEADHFKENYAPELTEKQEMKIMNALKPEPKGEILVKGFGIHITRHDMQTLKGLNWLNDVVIDFYMNLIKERSVVNKALPNVYVFNTFFYPKLVSSGYESLKKWTKQVDIFSFDLILVPIHLGMHWCLSVIDFRSKEIKYYDSIGSSNDKCLEKLMLYLKAESMCKKKIVFHSSNWKKLNIKNIPQQMNGSDCGVFACMFAEYITRNCAITFSQSDMPYFRKKMIIEILEKQLLT